MKACKGDFRSRWISLNRKTVTKEHNLCDDSGADDLEVTTKYHFFVKTMERVNYDTGEKEWNPGTL